MFASLKYRFSRLRLALLMGFAFLFSLPATTPADIYSPELFHMTLDGRPEVLTILPTGDYFSRFRLKHISDLEGKLTGGIELHFYIPTTEESFVLSYDILGVRLFTPKFTVLENGDIRSMKLMLSVKSKKPLPKGMYQAVFSINTTDIAVNIRNAEKVTKRKADTNLLGEFVPREATADKDSELEQDIFGYRQKRKLPNIDITDFEDDLEFDPKVTLEPKPDE